MTRKDYIAMAGFLRDLKPINQGRYVEARWTAFVDYLCVRFAQTNPRFDADKFREACERGGHPDPRGPMPLEMREDIQRAQLSQKRRIEKNRKWRVTPSEHSN